jgi:hypothetical protein
MNEEPLECGRAVTGQREREREKERERKREIHVHAPLSPPFSLSLSHPLSLAGEQGAHTLFTGQR